MYDYCGTRRFDAAHAHALDKLAEQYQGLEFAIIFIQTDICSLEDVATPEDKMSWVKELKHIKLYRSVAYTPTLDDPNNKHYFQSAGVLAASMQRLKPYATPLHLPHTFFIAHDKVYDYSEPRISSFIRYPDGSWYPGVEELTEDFYKTFSKNLEQFLIDADNEI